ncbi:hypothetical protein DDSR119_46 [Pseudomonas phage DDSR119]|nr:hypothetical protein DDSR119_46 [Pseudomonas phage DDSR119]
MTAKPTTVRIPDDVKSQLVNRYGSMTRAVSVMACEALRQPVARGNNRYGVDMHYVRKKLVGVLESLDDLTPEELARSLVAIGFSQREKRPQQVEPSPLTAKGTPR